MPLNIHPTIRKYPWLRTVARKTVKWGGAAITILLLVVWLWSGWLAGAFIFWFPTLVSLLATAFAWRADAMYRRRPRVGRCPSCGYDRAGLADAVLCPECGTIAPTSAK